ncbi:MAG: hypothetical protein MJZ10_14040 [Fibrobacter sp.]|nr:hypothetical protein [Fibrobacter sp.]
MTKLLELIGTAASKYGLFPAVSIIALLLGLYGCYAAQKNALAIKAQEVNIAHTEKLTDRMSGVEKNLIELTTQIRLLVDGKLVVTK